MAGVLTSKALAIGIVVALALAGCRPKTPPAPPPPAPEKDQVTQVVPGHVVGKLRDEHGRPLGKVTIRVSGQRADGQPHHQEHRIAEPASSYQLALPQGTYGVEAVIEVTHQGQALALPLHPTDARPADRRQPSEPGIVKDFVWHLSGLRPGGDGVSPEAFYGGAVAVELRDDFLEGERIRITLTPIGPLIDGNTGEPREETLELPFRQPADRYVTDVPPGRYRARAELISLNDAASALRVALPARGDPTLRPQGAESVELDFSVTPAAPGAPPRFKATLVVLR